MVMATTKACRSLIWVTIYTCVVLTVASPTRRQFISITETSSSDPVVTNEAEDWDDTDDFDLEGDGWLKEASASPSSIPQNPEYDDYEDIDDDDIVRQDAEETNSNDNNHEFLFLPPTDTRLVLDDDDDDQSGLIKVRHSSKNSYAEPQVEENSVETSEKGDSDSQFVFTIDEDEEEDDTQNKVDNSNRDDDFVIEDSDPKSDNNVEVLPRREVREDDDDDDDLVDDDDDDDAVFESPEEEAQVIYGDHVFLY